MTDERIVRHIGERGITRVCHFTPFRNILQIVSSGNILSAARLQAEHPDVFNPTDELRLDGKPGHISCSIEYPNVFYLQVVEKKQYVFVDHAVVMTKPIVLARSTTEYCPRNSASMVGTKAGLAGFQSVFAQTVRGSGGTYARESGHPLWLPTDLQAEVHVESEIPIDLVTGVVVKDKTRAKRLLAQLRIAQLELPVPLYVAPDLFRAQPIVNMRGGAARPVERLFDANQR
jgi:hypothetical protein